MVSIPNAQKHLLLISLTIVGKYSLWSGAIYLRNLGKSTTVLFSSTGNDILSSFESLTLQCSGCLDISYQKYMEGIGRDREGSWIEKRELEKLLTILDDLKPSQGSLLNQYIASSPKPLFVKLKVDSKYDITLLHAARSSAFQPRRHNAGTILLYKNLYGCGYLKSYINEREIKYDILEDEHIIRLGGPSRVFGSGSSGPAAMLEVALHPPRRLDEGLKFDDEFEISANNASAQGFMRLEIDESDAYDMFGERNTDLIDPN